MDVLQKVTQSSYSFFFLVVLAYMQFMLQSDGLKLKEKGAPIVKCFSGMLPAQLSH